MTTSLQPTALQPTSLQPLRLVALLATAMAGVLAGFFATYTFSVQRGLAIVDDETYVATFQAINATIRSFEFALVFFGAVPVAVLALVLDRSGSDLRRSLWIVGVVLLLATLIITFVGNVPLNRDLEAVTREGATQGRAAFEATWNQLNGLRTATSLLGFLALLASRTRRRS